jgi:cell division protein FtsW (lipid II flippase)
VQTRVEAWLHRFAHASRHAQIIEAQYGMAWGGLLGRGWGNGAPGRIPLANSDFIAAAIGEELGVAGLAAIVVLYAILVARGLRIGLAARDGFGKLLASGLAFVIALQVFAIIGGVTRLLPLTGLTTPFMSQGGSSLLANWIIVAVLLQISNQARRPVVEVKPAPIIELDEQVAHQGVGADDAPTQNVSAAVRAGGVA